MSQFFRIRTLSRKLVYAFSITFLLLTLSGLFSHLNSSIPKSATEGDIFSKRFKAWQAGAMAMKNVASVQSNLDKIARWTHAGFHGKEIDFMGNEQLAVLDETNEAIKITLDAEWLTTEEKGLYEVILGNFANYRDACSTAVRTLAADPQMAALLIRTADDRFEEVNRSLHGLMNCETRLCREKSSIPNRNLSAALGGLYPAAGGCHGSGRTDGPMSRQVHYRSCQ